ncbi:MAG: VPLPA-CTERM sorting domain-containing protein [Gammaproteobacteria bacterium]|nr:VPLPA-CTERM sorting domain-containing protein [Gammaproteobacteria bacterium]
MKTTQTLAIATKHGSHESALPHKNNHSSWILLAALLPIFASPVQAASVSASSSVLYNLGDFNGNYAIYGSPTNSAGFSTSTVGFTVPAGNLAASGSASVSFGALHANAFAGAAGAVPYIGQGTQTRGLAGATWIDELTISSPTLTGSAFARATFSLSGGLASYSGINNVGALGNSTVAAVVRVNGGTVFSSSGQLVSRNGIIETNTVSGTQSSSGLTGTFSFDVPFVFGTPFQLSASLDAFTQALATVPGDEASAYSNFGSSGYWGGISEVHLANGTVLNGYSLSSTSGFDWTNAYPTSTVPVPAAMWLFGSGLIGLVGVARRRRH